MKTINLGILAHADAGKTTLTEQILYRCGMIRSLGSVDTGTAQTDSLPIEQERGISVKTACASVTWEETKINLIDTPGHSDFISEVDRSLSVLDYGVLVISAVEGLEAQTEILLDAACSMKLPLFLFLNKADRAGSRSQETLVSIQTFLQKKGIGLLNLTELQEEGSNSVSVRLRSGSAFAEEIIDICEEEDLMESYLSSGTLEEDLAASSLSSALSQCRFFPVICGSTKFGVGVELLLHSIHTLCREREPESQELYGRVFKVEHDSVLGKCAYLRLFSGELQGRQSVWINRNHSEEKVTRLRLPLGRKKQDIEKIAANEIAAVYGLSSIKAGDEIGTGIHSGKPVSIANPLLSVKVSPKRPEELTALLKALTELSDEDPLLDFEWVPQKRELRIRISGKSR